MNRYVEYFEWAPQDMLEIILTDATSFLKIKETLSRIGVASKKEKILYPSCYILHKRFKFYIMNFKELLALNGKVTNITVDDIERRNTIASLLVEWKLCSIVDEKKIKNRAPLSNIKIIPFKDKKNWFICHKYTI